MPVPNVTDYGILSFTPIESYADPYRGLGADARTDRLVAELLSDEPPRPDSVSDWPRVRTAIRRDGLFVVETETPSFTAMLRFDPDHPDVGDYEIHRRPHGGIERGHITKVVAIAADEKDSRLSMLTQFVTRYAVATVSVARPHARMMWRIGLRDFRSVVETDGADDDVA